MSTVRYGNAAVSARAGEGGITGRQRSRRARSWPHAGPQEDVVSAPLRPHDLGVASVATDSRDCLQWPGDLVKGAQGPGFLLSNVKSLLPLRKISSDKNALNPTVNRTQYILQNSSF